MQESQWGVLSQFTVEEMKTRGSIIFPTYAYVLNGETSTYIQLIFSHSITYRLPPCYFIPHSWHNSVKQKLLLVYWLELILDVIV